MCAHWYILALSNTHNFNQMNLGHIQTERALIAPKATPDVAIRLSINSLVSSGALDGYDQYHHAKDTLMRSFRLTERQVQSYFRSL